MPFLLFFLKTNLKKKTKNEAILELFVCKIFIKCFRECFKHHITSRPHDPAGVPSSRLGHSVCVSWCTKLVWVVFSSGFHPFSPTTNLIPPFLHSDLFLLFHFIYSAPMMVRQASLVNILPSH